jgi:hypothetical protein
MSEIRYSECLKHSVCRGPLKTEERVGSADSLLFYFLRQRSQILLFTTAVASRERLREGTSANVPGNFRCQVCDFFTRGRLRHQCGQIIGRRRHRYLGNSPALKSPIPRPNGRCSQAIIPLESAVQRTPFSFRYFINLVISMPWDGQTRSGTMADSSQ